MMRSRQKHKPHDSHQSDFISEDRSLNSGSKDAGRRFCTSWKTCLPVLVCGLVLYYFNSSVDSGVGGGESRVAKKTPTPATKSSHDKLATNHACDGFDGIYHIQSGDVGGAAATIFFQFVIAQLIYAEDHNYKPWVHFNNISHHVYDQEFHNATQSQTTVQFNMMKGMQVEHRSDVRLHRAAYPGKPYPEEPLHPHSFSMTGNGVWETYFEAVSDFVPGDKSCELKPLLTMDIWLITPGLHIYAEWTPRMWRYDVLPDYMQQRHLTLREWLTPQRIRAHDITQKYIRVKPYLWEQAEQLLVSKSKSRSDGPRNCVGMHVRWSDKGGGRRLIDVDEFLPYVERFLQNGGNCVLLATDSGKVLQHVDLNWPEHVRAVLSSQGENVVRSNDETPVFEIQKSGRLVSHHRTNTEVLVDILALSKCKFILHGHSAVSDAAMYLNGDLIYQSVNLEDTDDLSLDEFGSLVKDVIVRQVGIDRPKYFAGPWWQQPSHGISSEVRDERPAKNSACDGYRGILHIAIGGGDEFSFGMTFFHLILNQLLYADMYNLKPWVHLEREEAKAVYDDAVHIKNKEQLSLEMLTGMKVQLIQTDAKVDGQVANYPGDVDTQIATLTRTKVIITGNGVWNSYFAPVSDFDPNDHVDLSSCKDTPLVSLNKTMVSTGLHKWAPWSVKSFRYSGMPDHKWWTKPVSDGIDSPMESSQHARLADWYFPMRAKAHDIIKKYYRPHPFIWKRVHEVNPRASNGNQTGKVQPPCLAVHIRQGDKEGYGKRKPSRIRDFKPYIEAFLRVTDGSAGYKNSQAYASHVYLATDSWRVMDAISENWSTNLTSRIRSQGERVVRSVRWVPAHLLEPRNHHRVNLEALVDILAMSKCQFLLHGFSTVSEAAIYTNLDLHTRSVNLDDQGHISVQEFEGLVRADIMPADG